MPADRSLAARRAAVTRRENAQRAAARAALAGLTTSGRLALASELLTEEVQRGFRAACERVVAARDAGKPPLTGAELSSAFGGVWYVADRTRDLITVAIQEALRS